MRTPARGAGAHLDIRPVARFDGAFDDLWQSIETKRFAGPTGPTGPTVAALRDAAYLNWRYTTCPGRRYTCLAAYRAGRRAPDGGRLDGLLVFTPSPRPKLRDAFILELLARNDDQDVLRALLLRALTMLARAGLALVAASFPTGSAEAAVLRDLGFLPWAGWVLGIELVLTPTTEKGPCPAGHLSNWYFSLGDWLAY